MTYQWATPKTNWKQNDRFNSEIDYNRIKNNIGYLKGEYLKLYFPVKFYELSEDKHGYEGIPQYDEFNNMELTLANLVKGTHTLDIGLVSLFYPDTPFVDWIELNRLEKGTVILYNGLKSQQDNIRKLAFTLGGGEFD